MGTGLVTIFWYVACGGFVALTIGVGVGLFMWGKHKENRRKQGGPPS